jgi:hypothetical protein
VECLITHNATPQASEALALEDIYMLSSLWPLSENYIGLSSPGYYALRVRERTHLYVVWPVQLNLCIFLHLLFGPGKVGGLDRQIARWLLLLHNGGGEQATTPRIF